MRIALLLLEHRSKSTSSSIVVLNQHLATLIVQLHAESCLVEGGLDDGVADGHVY